jgi:hypothetical protein
MPQPVKVIQLARFTLQSLQGAIEQRHCQRRPYNFSGVKSWPGSSWYRRSAPPRRARWGLGPEPLPFLSAVAVAFIRDEVPESRE